MLELYRFILSISVVLTHCYLCSRYLFGIYPGIIAVFNFYILAGYVATGLLNKKFHNNVWMFYYERFLRIYPLYFFMLFLTLVFNMITKYGLFNFNLITIFNNITIIPLNYYLLFAPNNYYYPDLYYIPTAWNLGLEIQLYLLIPLLLKYHWLKVICAYISLFIFVAANIGLIDRFMWGYNLLPGVFYVFIIGISLYNVIHKKADKFDKIFLFTTYITMLVLFHMYGAREHLLGILIGIPVIYLLLKFRIKSRFTTFLGKLSYGMFISQFMGIWLVLKYNIFNFPLFIVIPIFSSILLSAIGYFLIEKKIERYRYTLS